MLINMVKAVTTRSGMKKTLTVKETEKQPPLETNLNKDETPRTAVSRETTNNSCEDNPKDTSIKEMYREKITQQNSTQTRIEDFLHSQWSPIQICIRSL